jgi:hypothetical protein
VRRLVFQLNKRLALIVMLLAGFAPAAWACNCACQESDLRNRLDSLRNEQRGYLDIAEANQRSATQGVRELRDMRNDVYELLLDGAEQKERAALTLCQ